MMNSNLPGLFLHSSHNPQRLRPGSAHFHLTYRINHFPHCNPKSAHKLKCLQYDLRKASFIEKHHSSLNIWALFDDMATVGLREE